MSEWQTCTIGELCHRVTSGGTPSRKAPSYYIDGTIPWIKTGELGGWYIDDAEEWITTEAIENSSAKLFPPETVLMAMYGQGNTITSVGILRREAATNQACCAMIVNFRVCHPHFLLYSLKHHKEQLLKLAFGASQRNLSVTTISSFPIELPPLETQRKIAAVLSAYDDLIENNMRRIKLLEQAAHDLYREWFVEFRFPGHEDVPLVDSGTEYGSIPQGWEVVRLKDIVLNITSGGTPSTTNEEYWNGGIPWLSSGETRNSLIISTEKTITELGVEESSTRFVKKLAIVIASAGQGKTRGQTSLLMIDTYINQSVLAIICNHEVATPLYIFLSLSARYDELRNISDGASSRGSLTKQLLNELAFLKPPKETLDDFDTVVMPMYEQMYNLMVRNDVLRETCDLLLPRLVSGEVDVSELEIEGVGT